MVLGGGVPSFRSLEDQPSFSPSASPTAAEGCALLGGTIAYCIQFLLGVTAIASLVYKRHIERPQRPWMIWAFDVGKQLVGGFLVHFMNIGVSFIMGKDGDECAWCVESPGTTLLLTSKTILAFPFPNSPPIPRNRYFINFFVDCTLGVAIVYAAHETICRVAKKAFGQQTALARIGHYGTPPSKRVWGAQCAAYLAAIVFNKVVVASLLYAAKGAMADFGNWLFGPLQSNPDAELVVVMVLCPWLLTSLQFWIFDYLLKAKDPTADGSADPADGGVGADGLSGLPPYTVLAEEKSPPGCGDM